MLFGCLLDLFVLGSTFTNYLGLATIDAVGGETGLL